MRTLLVTLLILFSAGTAQAVNLASDNTGQVLLFPYFTTRDNNNTLLSVTNTSSDIKALKVIVYEGDNAQSILTFNLYLPPSDVWTATLASDNNTVTLITTDNSCTVPNFFSAELNRAEIDLSAAFAEQLIGLSDTGRRSIDRAEEGFIQIIEMGTVAEDGLGENALIPTRIGNALVEPIPNNCAALAEAWSTTPDAGIWVRNAQTDMSPPTGGLLGDATIINVGSARAFAYNATALDNFYVPDDTRAASLNSAPEIASPELGNAFPMTSQVVIKRAGEVVLINDNWTTGLHAVEATLMVDQILNQYAVEAVIGGNTEWVLTLPTRRLSNLPSIGLATPFNSVFSDTGAAGPSQANCEFASISQHFDRNTLQLSIDTLAATPADTQSIRELIFCTAVNVVVHDSNSSVLTTSQPSTIEASGESSNLLGSRLLTVTGNSSTSGWLSIDFNTMSDTNSEFNHQLINPESGRVYSGLPAIGFNARTAAAGSFSFGTGFDHIRVLEISQ